MKKKEERKKKEEEKEKEEERGGREGNDAIIWRLESTMKGRTKCGK